MKTHRLTTISIFWALIALLTSAWAEEKPIDLGNAGTITREGGQKAIPVIVVSENSQMQALLQQAFAAHGAYEVVKSGPEGAGFTFDFKPAGETAVILTIKSAQPDYTQKVTGSDWREAALLAADWSVSKTAGLPGFFASRLAFVSDRSGSTEIYFSDLFMQNVRQLTQDRAKCVHPALSPDGKNLLYTSYYKNGFPDIYKIDIVSGKRSVFAAFKGTNTGGSYSPKGDAVAMILSSSGNAELYVSDANRGNMRRLVRTNALEADPAWSPDGAKIVFASDEPGKPQIYIIPAAGGEMQRLPTNISGYCAEPAWNPRNPKLIAFTCAEGSEFKVALYDMETKQSQIVTKGSGDAVEPCWLRDGRHLLYTERTPDYRRLVLLDTVSGKKTKLQPDFGNALQAGCIYAQP